MKKTTIFKGMKLKISTLLLFVTFLTLPNQSEAAGWETVPGGGVFATSTGLYTVEYQEFYLFGICLGSREIYRDSQGNQCSNPNGNQQ
jgi:hypothetical protein